MKKFWYILLVLIIMSFLIDQCNKVVDWVKYSHLSGSSSSNSAPTQPVNRNIQTVSGDLPNGGRYIDEYYLNDSGDKVYHGYRKNLFPSGLVEMEEKYEDGRLLWYVKYNDMGQIVVDTRK